MSESHEGSFGSLYDRLDAIGGSVEIRSSPGQGTCVMGHVPDPRPVAGTAEGAPP